MQSLDAYTPEMLAAVGAIVVLGIFVYGFGDVLRFSLTRVTAIAGVLFKDAVRKRVLYVAPVIMLGIVVVVQLQKPIDELDAIRQTIKASLFASGLMVTLLMLILASTHLGRDIESKVIFTVVTKPASRLEILFGKLFGFAMVSGVLMLMMCGFTWALVQFQGHQLQRVIAQRLEAGTSDEFTTAWLKHHQRAGLLQTIAPTAATAVNVFARAPEGTSPGTISPSQNAIIPFEVTPEELIPVGATNGFPGQGGLALELRLPFQRTTGPFVFLVDSCQLAITIVNEFDELLVGPSEFNKGQPIFITDTTATKARRVVISEQAAQVLARTRRFMVRLAPADATHAVSVLPESVKLIVAAAPGFEFRYLTPRSLFSNDQPQPILRGGFGRRGQRILGPSDTGTSVARFSLGTESQPLTTNTDADSPDGFDLELRVGVDRAEDSADQPTRLRVRVIDRVTQAVTPSLFAIPENGRATYLRVPKGPLTSGQYDIELAVDTPGHAIEIEAGALTQTTLTRSLIAVRPAGTLVGNLAGAFAGQWMLSIMIAAIALAGSTFLSWPLALVLTVTILGANWVVQQVGDALAAGIGARVADSAGIRDIAAIQTVSATVEGLAGTLRTVSAFLPNLDHFSLAAIVEQGIIVPAGALVQAGVTMLLFTLPAMALAYVILRNKEVAP